MSSRSRAAANLTYHLNDKVGICVRVNWDNPSGRPGHGAWRVEWTDGPTVETMRGHAADLVRYCRPLTTTMLRFSRHTTRQALAAAMLTLAHHGDLPERPALALAAAEHELSDTDTADWHHLRDHAGQLIEQAAEDLYQIVALIHATVTKPRHETPPATTPRACQHCAAPLATTRTGRPARYCGPPCRQAAHRTRDAVTKPRNETTCTTCSGTFAPTRTGRPARHCSPACRTRAWRHANPRSR
ncbi:MAG: hypothetical protein QOE61_5042 [Micromonosporaceae bacterium]|jgi:hypothetical protein|nr:hypothetical protein [Micromonosporaceae bacterium]